MVLLLHYQVCLCFGLSMAHSSIRRVAPTELFYVMFGGENNKTPPLQGTAPAKDAATDDVGKGANTS